MTLFMNASTNTLPFTQSQMWVGLNSVLVPSPPWRAKPVGARCPASQAGMAIPGRLTMEQASSNLLKSDRRMPLRGPSLTLNFILSIRLNLSISLLKPEPAKETSTLRLQWWTPKRMFLTMTRRMRAVFASTVISGSLCRMLQPSQEQCGCMKQSSQDGVLRLPSGTYRQRQNGGNRL